MKNTIRYACMLLLFFSLTTAYGQEKATEVKRTPEEQAVFEKSVPVNPAKIPAESQVDPKRDPGENIVGQTVWKPVVPTADPKTTRPKTQPETLKGNVTNNQTVNGPRTQPEGDKPKR